MSGPTEPSGPDGPRGPGQPGAGAPADHPPAEPRSHQVPADVADRLLRAIDQGRSGLAALVGPDLRVQWMSRSAASVIGMDADEWIGKVAVDLVHPDDVQRILDALAQRPDEAAGDFPISPVRYRIRRSDGEWMPVEAIPYDLLDDPVVGGFLVVLRPLGGEMDGIGRVIELLTTDAPLLEVLTACARVVPDYLGQAAVVGILDADPKSSRPGAVEVIGASPGSRAAHLVADERWWRPTVEDGKPRTGNHFADFPADLAEAARAEGFLSAWTLPLADSETGEVLGCVVLWAQVSAELTLATDDGLRQAARLATLVIGEQRRHQALRRAALTDPLTGLGNRSALRRRLDEATAPVTVALVDLDHFKPINDVHGHNAGDEVLQVVAQRLLAAVREDDCVVRFGGDEFAVVFDGPLPQLPDGRPEPVERLRAAVEHPIALLPGVTVSVGASVGYATAPARDAVLLADRALYDAKRSRPPLTGEPSRPGGDPS